MPDTLDWKEKYRNSVREMEAEEKRWNYVEKVLRLLVNRLCAAGMGAHEQLDEHLATISAANRRKADVSELETLARALTNAVTAVSAVEAVGPVDAPASPERAQTAERAAEPQRSAAAERPAAQNRPSAPQRTAAADRPTVPDRGPAPDRTAAPDRTPPPDRSAAPEQTIARDRGVALEREVEPARAVPAERWKSTCAAVRMLLERLTIGNSNEPVAAALSIELERAETDTALAEVLLRMAELVHERSEQIARERLQAAAVLADVGKRLEEMVEYFASSVEASRSGFADTEILNTQVMSQVRELSAEMSVASDLPSLQMLVSKGLESVGNCVRDFRARAEERLREQTTRTDSMRSRVAALEQETRELQGKLEQERDRARIDPLTGVANRKAFDERIAQEIARRVHTDGAVTLLIWDIDNFKSINDSYGHRAGDRVLQSVARCFALGVRSTDFVARIGGEEFAMVMVGLSMETAMRMANELRVAVEALRFHFRGSPVRVTVSCGFTEIKDREGHEAAFDRADSALYRAKNGGKNLCVAG
ncbi:MAG: diguanylate cyclase [Steroidobacteraceae bacterium]